MLFFSGAAPFYAALLIPFVAGTTLIILEILRRQPPPSLSAIYLFWLAVCGGLGWFLAAIPPYWIWSVYLLIPETAWAPSDAQQTKPFLFGLKKYFKQRALELIRAMIVFLFFAGAVLLLRQKLHGASYWVTGVFVLMISEMIIMGIKGFKK